MQLSRVRHRRNRRTQAASLVEAATVGSSGLVTVEALENRKLLAADLHVEIFGGGGNVDVGKTATYQIVITNVGNQTAANVHLKDPTPANTTFVTYTQDPNGKTPTNVILPAPGAIGTADFTFATLAPQETATFNVTVRVAPSAPDGSQFDNTVTATTTSIEDPTPGDDTVTSPASTVNSRADLRVVVTGPQTVVAGTDLVYTLTITNAGPTDAGTFALDYATPALTTFSSITPISDLAKQITLVTPRTGQTGNIHGTLDLFPVGGVATFQVINHVIPSAPESDPMDSTTDLTAAFSAGAVSIDRNPINNQAVTISTPVLVQADIAVTSNTDQNVPNQYESQFFTYIISVRNNGPSDAQTVAFIWNLTDQDQNGAAMRRGVFDQDATVLDPTTGMMVMTPPVVQLTGPGFTITAPQQVNYGTNVALTGNIDTLQAGASATFRVRVYAPIFATYISRMTATTATAQPPGATGNDTGGDQLIIPDAPLALVDTAPIAAVVNRQLENVYLMEFQDFKIQRTINNRGFAGASVADHQPARGSTTIDWGDGTPLDIETLDTFGALNGIPEFRIFGTHTYTKGGLFTIKMKIVSDGGATLDVTTQAVVTGLRPLQPTANQNASAITGLFSSVNLGTFTDPTPVGNSIYTAQIDWGDGSGTDIDGTVVRNSNGTFTVFGLHKYTADGIYGAHVTIKASTDGGQDATFLVNVNSRTPPVSATGVNVSAVINQSTGPVTVATFTDPAGPQAVTDYSTTIDWGDGTTTNGAITLASGKYTVTDVHTYTSAGTKTITTTITHNTATTTVTSKATVGTGTPTPTPTPTNTIAASAKTFSGTATTALNGITVASFAATNTSVGTGGYSASINWGDGTSSSTGTIVKTAAGKFNVTGSHTYAKSGTFKPVVSIKVLSTGVTRNATDTANIAAILKPLGTSFSAALNSTFTKTIGSFVDNKGNTTASVYQITIDWGDGTSTSTGKATYDSTNKRFNVSGTHKYTKKSPTAGFKLSIAVKALSGLSKNATTTIFSTIFVT